MPKHDEEGCGHHTEAKRGVLNCNQTGAGISLKSEEAMGQESSKSYKLRIVRQLSGVSREQERVKSMIWSKAGEINRILKVKAAIESNSLENLKQQHP